MAVAHFGVLNVFAAAEKASEVYTALASAFGGKDFFKNKGPDPTVWNAEPLLREIY